MFVVVLANSCKIKIIDEIIYFNVKNTVISNLREFDFLFDLVIPFGAFIAPVSVPLKFTPWISQF